MNLTILKICAGFFVVLLAFGAGWRTASNYAGNVYDKERAEAREQAAAALAKAQSDARAQEQRNVKRMGEIDRAYQDKLKHKDRERVAAVAAARAGGLYIHAACPATGVSGTATGTGSGDGTTRIRLPDADADFLLGLAAEADQVAEQLHACQSIVRSDRQR
jgi:hypothetical protein